jgi:hypothetical protein
MRFGIDTCAAKARRRLGWSPLFNLDGGLQKTIAWHADLISAGGGKMIQAIRKTERVTPDGALTLYLPEFGGADVEIIILPRNAAAPPEMFAAMRLQEQSGFARRVLADPAEDVWNDL